MARLPLSRRDWKPTARARLDDVLETYIRWVTVDLAARKPLPRRLVAELQKYGERRGEEFDLANSVQIMQQVEKEGFEGFERFNETARRLGRFKGGQPDAGKIKNWWQRRREVAEWVDDGVLARRPGRPRKAVRPK